MHEVFEGINSEYDIPSAVGQLVLEGKIGKNESESLISKLKDLISSSPVSTWFKPGSILMKEAGILLPAGSIRRPDRVIIDNGKATIIDFKFGDENPHYSNQISLYRSLLKEMDYEDTEAFIWYVDSNKILKI
jgi:ATP-dependent helicase/nuclease subunit A